MKRYFVDKVEERDDDGEWLGEYDAPVLDPHGPWVYYEDAAALERRVGELRSLVEERRSRTEKHSVAWFALSGVLDDIEAAMTAGRE